VDKENVGYIYIYIYTMEYDSPIMTNGINLLASKMDGIVEYHVE
jgi:hypothetical protein